MKHHSQVFIALFALLILININPLQEGYTNTQDANIYSDMSNNLETTHDHKWLNSENGGSSSEFKFSDNYKFKNPFQDISNNTFQDISNNTINEPEFKLRDYYWPLSENFLHNK